MVWYDNNQGPDGVKSVVSQVTTITPQSRDYSRATNSSNFGNDDEPSVYQPAVVSASDPSLPRPDSTVDELDGTTARRSQSDVLP